MRVQHGLCLVLGIVGLTAMTPPMGVEGLEGPPVQLAEVYREDVPVADYLVSEKYDGIRAIWKDGVLRTRRGGPIAAPQWFVEPLPKIWLDGELWTKRQDFETVSSIVRKAIPVDEEWRGIIYMVFDAPNNETPFECRAAKYTTLLNRLGLPHVKPVKQFRVRSNSALSTLLEKVTGAGAEGLMLHRAAARYREGRNDNLLKLKPYMDDEATVVGHIPGKGKLKGLMGALRVKWSAPSGVAIVFKIGTGFTNEERANPPPIGRTITFKYHGLTRKGVPRFASCHKQCGE